MLVTIKKILLSNKLFLAIIFVVGAFLVFWIFFDSKRNSVEEEIFRADVNPGIVTLRKGDTVEQKFGLPDEKISGVVLLVNPDKDSGRKINLAIFDLAFLPLGSLVTVKLRLARYFRSFIF